MAINVPKINIGGEIVDLKDIKKLVELTTIKEKDKITKDDGDIVEIDEQKKLYEEFKHLAFELQNSVKQLFCDDMNSKSVFSEKFPTVVGASPSEFLSYLDVDVKNNAEFGRNTINILQIAKRTEWKSITFGSKVVSVTQAIGGTNSNMFAAGKFDILVPNNAQKLDNSGITNANSPIVGSIIDPGKFYINDKPITLVSGDSLTSITNKINSLKIGVTASTVDNLGNITLVIKSDEIGLQNAFSIQDPDNIFNNSPFIDMPEYKSITLASGDNLQQIAHKINTIEKQTNLHAETVQVGKNQYALILRSLAPGFDNAFKIKNNNITLTGSNTDSVFKGVFNNANTVVESGQDAILSINGITITYPVNTLEISDGIKITLKAPTVNPLTFDIQCNINKITEVVIKFSEQYNNLIKFCQENQIKDNKGKAYLRNDNNVNTMMNALKSSLYVMETADIGISSESIVTDEKDGRRKYNDLMKVDVTKLMEGIQNDMTKVRGIFDDIFEASSGDFMPPFFKKNITVIENGVNKPITSLTSVLSLDLNKVNVKAKASVAFSTPNAAVGVGHNKLQFSPGTFYINNKPIHISNGMTLAQICSQINSASSMSRISAAVQTNADGSYIQLTQYSDNYATNDDDGNFKNLEIYDPNNVLNDVFSNTRITSDFDISNTNTISSNIISGGNITINGTTINLGATCTIDSFLSSVNTESYTTGVTVEALLNQSTNKYYLRFYSTKLQDITLNTSNAFNNNIRMNPIGFQQNDKFFDGSKAATMVITSDLTSYNKRCRYSCSGDTPTSGGRLYIVNNESDKLEVENFEIINIGSNVQSEVEITISQGVATYVNNEMERLLKHRNEYNGDSLISVKMRELDGKKSDITNLKRDHEDKLKNREAALYTKYSKMAATFDKYDAYDDLIEALMNDSKKD